MKNKYCFGEFISNCFAFVFTKIFYRGARFIARPLYLRGRKSISGWKGLSLGHGCRLDLNGKKKTLFMGDNCDFGDYVHIVAFESVTIGNNLLCASKVFISDTSHGSYSCETSNQSDPSSIPSLRELVCKPVKIGNNVWIGENVVVLSGVSIGDGCIIGANSVVTKSFGECLIIAGNPAVAIKRFDKDNNTWVKI